MMRNGWQRIVAGALTAVAPLAVTLALGTATAHANTYAERGGGSSGGGSGTHSGGGSGHSEPRWWAPGTHPSPGSDGPCPACETRNAQGQFDPK
jgi:hypothetical protein